MNCRNWSFLLSLPPSRQEPEAEYFLENSLPCSRVRLERPPRAPGEGSVLQKPLSCVSFGNNVFELAAVQRQVLQGQTVSGAPLWSGAAALPSSRLLPFSYSFTTRHFLSLFPLAHLCFLALVTVIDCSLTSNFSVLVSPRCLLLRVRLGNLRAFQPQTFWKFVASCINALNPPRKKKTKLKHALLF